MVIAFLSKDPGGANTTIPIITMLNNKAEYKVFIFGLGEAVGIYKTHGINAENLEEISGEVKSTTLEKRLFYIRPDLLITGTSADDFTERRSWQIAKSKGIRTIAILDAWVNYAVRFSRYSVFSGRSVVAERDLIYLPDYIIVMDQKAKEDAVKEGLPEEKIYVGGQPYLEYLENNFQTYGDVAAKDYINLITNGRESTKLIVYASDNLSDAFPVREDGLYWGYDEKSIFSALMDCIDDVLGGSDDYAVLIRPHPKEKGTYWEDLIHDNLHSLRIYIDRASRTEEIINASDIVVGMFSMLLVEAALAKKRIISVQIGAIREAPFILEQMGYITPAFSKKELKIMLQDYFNGVYPQTQISFQNNAIQNICKFIDKLCI